MSIWMVRGRHRSRPRWVLRRAAFAALALVLVLAVSSAARADFGATKAQVETPSLHGSQLSCGATSGCVITSSRHVVARGENKREIRAVDVWLSPGIEYGVVSVVVVEANAGRDRFTVLEKSATSRSRVVGAGFSTPRLVLKKPLKVKTGQQVGLNVRGFSGFVPFNFHDSREAPKFADGGIASSDAWSGSGDPGEVYAVAGNNLLNDPASELSGKFALMPVRFITGVAKDLQIAKEFLKKEYPAPEGKPKFRLTVTYTGSKPAKNIRVVDEFSKNRLAIWRSLATPVMNRTGINAKQRKKTTPVTCEVQRIDRLLVRCRAREMKSGGRFVVVVTTRIAASSPALSYADDVDGAIQRRSCECA